MKTWLKIMLWSVVSGGIGFFGGWTLEGRKVAKMQEELNGLKTTAEALKAQALELERIATELADMDDSPAVDIEDVRKDYAGPAEAATDDDPDMVEEAPVIGDEAEVEQSPRIEFITEQEYYENAGGYPQEQLIWYSLDEVLWNKDTQTIVRKDEADRAIGYGTLNIFDTEEGTESIFVKNHIIPAMFRIDFMDAAWCDEHRTDEVADDE